MLHPRALILSTFERKSTHGARYTSMAEDLPDRRAPTLPQVNADNAKNSKSLQNSSKTFIWF